MNEQLSKDLSQFLSGEELQFAELLANTDQSRLAALLIGQQKASELLNEREHEIYREESLRKTSPEPLAAGKLVVVLKATRLCNLRCTYCHSWAEGPGNTMSFETTARTVHEILSIPNLKRIAFVWHGGEVTMLNTKFFKKLIWLQEQFRSEDQVVTHSIQSNATNFSTEWLSFLKSMGMSVGISVDGPPEVHDLRRKSKSGNGTSQDVRKGIQQLREYGIPYGALVVVDREVRDCGPKNLLKYFKEINLTRIDFLNIVPDNRTLVTSSLQEDFITYREFVEFLAVAFEVWWDEYRNDIDISLFDQFVQLFEKKIPTVSHCYWEGNCSNEIITLEANGDVSPCDKYVGDFDSNYGSLLTSSLSSLLINSKHHAKAQNEERESFAKMEQCEWFHVCGGGCPHDRMMNYRHVPGYDGTCCGTGKLLEVISKKVGDSRIEVVNVSTKN